MKQNDFRDPLTKVKGLGVAHDGVEHWINQRISAVILIFFSVWLVYNLSQHAADDYQTIITWLANPWNSAGVFLFFTTATYHAVLGIQVIIEDYVYVKFWRYGALLIIKILAVSLPMLSLFFLVRIALWGGN